MVENSASSSPPKPLQTPNCSGEQVFPPNPQNPTLSSPVVPPSPSSIDLPRVSSPQLVQFQPPISPSGTLDFPPKPLTMSQQQSSIMSPASNFQPALQRLGSIARINQIHQQFGAAMTTGGAIRQGMYGGEMNFGAQQQQLGGAVTRPGMMSQAGQLSMLPSQATGQFNMQSQMLAQPRQKTAMQGAQFHNANSPGQAMQGMQALGVMGPLTLNSPLRANGPLSYGQQRLIPGQLRQQLSQQATLTSPQKLIGQSLQRGSSLPATSSQVSGLTHNGQSTLGQGSISQQQWLKQAGMPSHLSPSYHIQQQQQRQQQSFLPQQLSSSQLHQKSLGLSPQHISQLLQQAQLGTTQQHQVQLLQLQQQQLQLQQLQQLQQQHQQHQQQHQQRQQSLKVVGSTVSKSVKGLQSDTSASGRNMLVEISSKGNDASNQLLGKRKMQDIVSQVDSSVKLDPEVEDILLELADDFIDSVTTLACRLAKHRKSSTLESKDLLLHMEKNWHLTIPGFLREEHKNQKVIAPIDMHKKRLEQVRTLMESQQMERDAAIGKVTFNQAGSNSAMNRMIKSSPISEQVSIPATSSQVLQKVPRF